jgi:glycosyltransferase involved in cell wall biosynthesis
MKIGIDAREIERGARTGIGRALVVFLDYFERQKDENSCVLFSTRPIERTVSSRVHNTVAPPAPSLIWDQIILPRLIRREKPDLFYSTYYKIPFRAACPCISTIYDLMYLTFPEYRKKTGMSRLYYKTFGRLLVKKAARIVTGSVYSQREIVGFYRVNPEKIVIIPLGVQQRFCPASAAEVERVKKVSGITGDYLLYTGNFKPHKNVGTLISAFAAIHERFSDLTLVLAGQPDHNFEAISEAIVSADLEKKIRCIGSVKEADLPALYSGARLFVMPSLYEGFGYPPLEAMACGTPVVCSNATSLPEVVRDGALLVDARNPQDMAKAMIQILELPDLALSLLKKGLIQARKFAGERYAHAVYDLLINTAPGNIAK